jgi:hypothetical protein
LDSIDNTAAVIREVGGVEGSYAFGYAIGNGIVDGDYATAAAGVSYSDDTGLAVNTGDAAARPAGTSLEASGAEAISLQTVTVAAISSR